MIITATTTILAYNNQFNKIICVFYHDSAQLCAKSMRNTTCNMIKMKAPIIPITRLTERENKINHNNNYFILHTCTCMYMVFTQEMATKVSGF